MIFTSLLLDPLEWNSSSYGVITWYPFFLLCKHLSLCLRLLHFYSRGNNFYSFLTSVSLKSNKIHLSLFQNVWLLTVLGFTWEAHKVILFLRFLYLDSNVYLFFSQECIIFPLPLRVYGRAELQNMAFEDVCPLLTSWDGWVKIFLRSLNTATCKCKWSSFMLHARVEHERLSLLCVCRADPSPASTALLLGGGVNTIWGIIVKGTRVPWVQMTIQLYHLPP